MVHWKKSKDTKIRKTDFLVHLLWYASVWRREDGYWYYFVSPGGDGYYSAAYTTEAEAQTAAKEELLYRAKKQADESNTVLELLKEE